MSTATKLYKQETSGSFVECAEHKKHKNKFIITLGETFNLVVKLSTAFFNRIDESSVQSRFEIAISTIVSITVTKDYAGVKCSFRNVPTISFN